MLRNRGRGLTHVVSLPAAVGGCTRFRSILLLPLAAALAFLLFLDLLRRHGLRAAGDGDWGGLLDDGAVLADEFVGDLEGGRYRLFDFAGDGLLMAFDLDFDFFGDGLGGGQRAEVAVRGEGGVGALGEADFECVDGVVGDCLERGGGDPGFADERVAVKSIVTL